MQVSQRNQELQTEISDKQANSDSQSHKIKEMEEWYKKCEIEAKLTNEKHADLESQLSQKTLQLTNMEQKTSQQLAHIGHIESSYQSLLAEKEKLTSEVSAVKEKLSQQASEMNNYQREYQNMAEQMAIVTTEGQKLGEEKKLMQAHFEKVEGEWSAGFANKKAEYEAVVMQRESDINQLRNANESQVKSLQVEVSSDLFNFIF